MKKNNDRKHASPWGSSLKYLPWDNENEKTEVQQLISNTIQEWYYAKHRLTSDEEIQLINSVNKRTCPYCNSKKIVKHGLYKNKVQRYHCKECNQNFSPLTNTIFEGKKIPISEWVEYLMHLFEFHSIKSSARDNRNSESTGKYWLMKVFAVLDGIQDDVVLEENIYLDETFFSVVKSKTIKKDGKQLRGISRNKICVATAIDNHGHYLFKVEYTSKPSDKSTWKALGSHIKENSHLIHDGEKSHGILIERLKLTNEVYPATEVKKLADKDNPLDPINRIHALTKRFIKSHGGYDRENLQDWMNLVWFILSKPNNRYEKIEKFIKMALISPQKVKFRDVMIRKDD